MFGGLTQALREQRMILAQEAADDERGILERSFYAQLRELLLGQTAQSGPKGFKGGVVLTDEVLEHYTRGQWRQFSVADEQVMETIETFSKVFDDYADAYVGSCKMK